MHIAIKTPQLGEPILLLNGAIVINPVKQGRMLGGCFILGGSDYYYCFQKSLDERFPKAQALQKAMLSYMLA